MPLKYWQSLATLTNLNRLIVLKGGRLQQIKFNDSPILVASSAEVLEQKGLKPIEILEMMQINPEKKTAKTILISKDSPVKEINLKTDPDTTLDFKVSKFEQTISNTLYNVSFKQDCYISIPHAWYPFIEVTMDEKIIAPMKSAYGMIVLPVKTGQHVIEISPIFSQLRKICLMITIFSFAGFLIALWYFRKRKSVEVES